MFKPTIADMQKKYCGDCYDIYFIQNQYQGNHKRGGAAEGRVTSFVVAAVGRHFCQSLSPKSVKYIDPKYFVGD